MHYSEKTIRKRNNMKKASFWTLFAFMNLLFVFVTIYQHNVYTNLTYRKQRLEKIKSNLKFEKNKELISLLSIKKELLDSCLTDTTMKSLSLSQIRSIKREYNDQS